ncbi:MAG: AGE family epimerase/isomerase [Sphingobacteriales bacterium]|nr:AGE family epimerase/isomerase [Sphingobacteriales bacterium]MBI3717605.1 AGE family epimerase/isomerase [Sphingobacteriales bacterium]
MTDIQTYRQEMMDELTQILNYWLTHTIDVKYGGFYGRIDENGVTDETAPKGSVLNSRILWAFSAGYLMTHNDEYLKTATRVFKYILDNFKDKQYGGVYWSLTAEGKPLQTRKQMYALAFCMYGVSEYYKATQDERALNFSKELFQLLEIHSFDKKNLGYIEAASREWQPLEDVRLSAKDNNEKKTMNTHLHIIEAYANFYRIYPEVFVKLQIENLLSVFEQYIINHQHHHLNLFMDEHWTLKSNLISYGHDIEAAWLLCEAAASIQNHDWINRMNNWSLKITQASLEGLDKDGGLWYEYEPGDNYLVKEKHSWPQAEAMVGFMNAYELTNDEKYLQLSYQSWKFVKQYIKDQQEGEWYWGIEADGSPMKGQDKIGFWKCPYHNSRACIEVINRINKLVSINHNTLISSI